MCMMGDPNASIPTPQPVISRPMFGAHESVLSETCIAFVSGVSLESVRSSYNLKKKVLPVKRCRKIGKKDMKLNDYCPNITVDPESYKVAIDGKEIGSMPSKTLPLTQSVFMF